MLSPTAKKFVEALNLSTVEDAAGEHLPANLKIVYGNFSTREENGVKVQDATLYFDGKFVAAYDATSDTVLK